MRDEDKNVDAETIKSCCTKFYENDLVAMLFFMWPAYQEPFLLKAIRRFSVKVVSTIFNMILYAST